MAYVICVCGAGGKTTYCFEKAREYAKLNKKVCITTTTHMWNNVVLDDINKLVSIEAGKVYVFGVEAHDMFKPVSSKDYELICEKFDYVIIEADGSKCMPFKIPKIEREPVIPDNVNEIIIIYTRLAFSRKISDVCFRYVDFKDDDYLKKLGINDDTILTEDLILKINEHYYIEPLKSKFQNAKIFNYKVDYVKDFDTKNYRNIALVLLASGESKRFGEENKLLKEINGEKIYSIAFNMLYNIKKELQDKIKSLSKKENNFRIDLVVVSSHDEILNDKYINEQAKVLKNDQYKEGISASIRLSTKSLIDYDAIVFFNADMPNLIENDISNMILYSLVSNSNIGCMYHDTYMTPALFKKKYFDELLVLSGDNGAKSIIIKHDDDVSRYHTNNDMFYDIDTIEDYERVVNTYGEK